MRRLDPPLRIAVLALRTVALLLVSDVPGGLPEVAGMQTFLAQPGYPISPVLGEGIRSTSSITRSSRARPSRYYWPTWARSAITRSDP
jgi:hypothetical protein